MNIVKLQNDLKDLSDRQLMDTMQAGSAPQYLVLGEMQRRKKMRTEAQSQPQQSSSVAEEIMQPSMGIAAMPQNPQVQMYGGGIVGFASGKKVSGYTKGSAESCWTDPTTGKSNCPPDKPRMVGKKFAEGKRVYKDVEQIESSGRQFDSEGNVLTSPKGAKGVMQVMPTTAMDPGYGAKNIFQLADDLGVDYGGKKDLKTAELLLSNEMLNRAMGEEYFDAMANRFGSEEAAMAAYNAGPGRVGRSGFAESGDREALPDETQDYLAKADKLRAQRAPESIPSMTAAEGIAALGESKMPLTDSELRPKPSAPIPVGSQTAAEAIAALGEGKMKPELKPGDEGFDWSKVPGDSPLRGIYDGASYYDVEGEPTIFRDQGGASDVRDMVGQQYGSPTIYENTTDPYNDNLPIRPTGDDGLMALAPKSARGKVRGLLPGEKEVNAAELASAETYTNMPANKEYGPVQDNEPLDIESMLGGIADIATKADSEKYDEETARMIASLTSQQFRPGGSTVRSGPESIVRDVERSWLESRGDSTLDAGDAGPTPETNWYGDERPEDPEGYAATAPEAEMSVPEAKRKVKEDAAEEARKKALEDALAEPETVTTENPFRKDVPEAKPINMQPEKDKDSGLNNFLMDLGLGMMASKRGDFFGAAGEAGLGALKSQRESQKAAQEAELARLLESGRMQRGEMSAEATRYAADAQARIKEISALSDRIIDLEKLKGENYEPEEKERIQQRINDLSRRLEILSGPSAAGALRSRVGART
jgi:hypothetical protein